MAKSKSIDDQLIDMGRKAQVMHTEIIALLKSMAKLSDVTDDKAQTMYYANLLTLADGALEKHLVERKQRSVALAKLSDEEKKALRLI